MNTRIKKARQVCPYALFRGRYGYVCMRGSTKSQTYRQDVKCDGCTFALRFVRSVI